jgi:hypothetical protein
MVLGQARDRAIAARHTMVMSRSRAGFRRVPSFGWSGDREFGRLRRLNCPITVAVVTAIYTNDLTVARRVKRPRRSFAAASPRMLLRPSGGGRATPQSSVLAT